MTASSGTSCWTEGASPERKAPCTHRSSGAAAEVAATSRASRYPPVECAGRPPREVSACDNRAVQTTATRDLRSTGDARTRATWHLGLLMVFVAGCGGRHVSSTAEDPTTRSKATSAPDVASEGGEPPQAEVTRARDRCYPYLAKPRRKCPTKCESRDDCAGSRGPADFAENGWPLDCIRGKCVPLPPESVQID